MQETVDKYEEIWKIINTNTKLKKRAVNTNLDADEIHNFLATAGSKNNVRYS